MKQSKSAILCGCAALLALLATSACGKETVSANTETETLPVPETEAVTEPHYYREAGIPDKDFGGKEFKILQHGPDGADSVGFFEYDTDALNGEKLNDAVFERNRRIEDAFHVTVNAYSDELPAQTAKKLILAGDDTYHVIADWPMQITAVSTDGVFANLLNVSSINTENVWWNQSAIDNFQIAGKLYLITGDYVLYEKQRLFCVYYNSAIAQKLDMGDLYQMVRDGKWTIDMMNTYAKEASNDTNGDGKMRAGEDEFGFDSGSFTVLHYLLYGMDNHLAVREPDGTYTLTYLSEHMVDSVEKLKGLLDKNVSVYHEDIYQNFGNARMYFQLGTTLFYHDVLHSMRLIDSDIAYGVLPQPKFDEAQEKYLTSVHYAMSGALALPANNPDFEMTGILLEALSADSHYTTLPLFVEEILKVKNAPDPGASEMITLIFDNIMHDCFNLYSVGSADSRIYENLYSNRGNNYVSAMEKSVNAVTKAFDKLYETYRNLE